MSEPTGKEVQQGGGGNPLAYLPRLVIGALDDLHSIARSVSVLPEVARSLASIEARVTSMDEEVKKMRSGVDSLNGEVVGVQEVIVPLQDELQEMHRAVRPLRRLTSRIPGRGVPPSRPESDS
jgi:hypothetical protein